MPFSEIKNPDAEDIVEHRKEEDRFSINLKFRDVNGVDYPVPGERLPYDAFIQASEQAKNLVEHVVEMMRESDWSDDRGVVTAGHWRLRGDLIMGVYADMTWYKYFPA